MKEKNLLALEKQAFQGDAEAQCRLGDVYFFDGDEDDLARSVYWYGMAARRGWAEGQYNLAYQYEQGLGVPQDYERAGSWYKKAALQGHGPAANNL